MENYLKEALELVKAQASVRTMSEDEMTTMLKKLAEGIRALSENPSVFVDEDDESSIDPKKAIKEKSITCVICGKTFKLLTKKHLATHGFSVEAYREHCGYKKGTPLVCKSLQRERRKKMKDMRLWERRS